MILFIEPPNLRDAGLLGGAELEVGKGHRGRGEVTAASTASAAIQPRLVTSHVPQREHGYNVMEVIPEKSVYCCSKSNMDDLPHPLHIVRVIASIEAGCPALLGKVVEALLQVVAIHDLAVADPVGLGGVYRPPWSVLTSDA